LGEDAEVGLETGLRAAEKLQSILDKRDKGDDVAEMRRQINQILDAVKSTVPQESWIRLSRSHLASATKPTMATTFSIRATAMTWMTQCKC